jgi:hypothetical protein
MDRCLLTLTERTPFSVIATRSEYLGIWSGVIYIM